MAESRSSSSGWASDLGLALKIAAQNSWRKSIQSWFWVPIGLLVMLLACFGIDRLFAIGNVSFPGSVASLLILFFGLLLSEQVLGEHRTRKAVALVEIPGLWSLRWINVFFTPSFVRLPLSPHIGVVEVFKIIAVFIIGFMVAMIMTAYMTRGLQLVLGSSKRAMTERAEELGPQEDDIPMTATPRSEGSPTPVRTSTDQSSLDISLQPPPRAQAPSQSFPDSSETQDDSSERNGASERPSLQPQEPLTPTRSTIWAANITNRLNFIIYGSIFLFVGIPIYYVVGYAMPLQLTFAVMSYLVALNLLQPTGWRQYLHPVLVSSAFTILGLWVFALIKGQTLNMALTEYKTNANYLELWEGSHALPGAGDIFSSVLDASIVALALPMYQYRRELKHHFFAIVIPNISMSIGSLFIYPKLCYAIGITATRSLAFPSRSLTLALAIPATSNLGGDPYTIAAIAIGSGVVGALIGQKILAMFRIPEDDYVTRGVTLGGNASAIATAMLLRTDPRAAALSSLSMSIFGTITVLFTSIPLIANAVRSLVDLGPL